MVGVPYKETICTSVALTRTLSIKWRVVGKVLK